MKLELGTTTVDVSHDNKNWITHLVLVLTNPHRLIGLVDLTPDKPTPGNDGEPFNLQHVCVYASQIGFQPSPDGRGVTIGGPRLVIPFDGIAPIRHCRVASYHGTVYLSHEPEDSGLREMLIEGYLRLFDPPKIVAPAPGDILLGKK